MQGAPYPEERGCSAAMGFVKSNPLNNDYYVNHWVDDVWYPAIIQAHHELGSRFPGYNISQIKQKFGGLRYYVDQGSCPDRLWDLDEVMTIISGAEKYAARLSQDGR